MYRDRDLEFTVSGRAYGPIRSLIHDAELRDRLRPFVFLDDVEHRTRERWGFPFHPHSGVATFTYLQAADLEHEDTEGHSGVVTEGSVQWMAAGGGVWHQETYVPRADIVSALQMWVVLPPDREVGPVEYQVAGPQELPQIGGSRVLAGTFQGARSPLITPYAFNYFDVRLGPHESWRFDPPVDHDVAWLYLYEGSCHVGEALVDRHRLAVFDRSPGRLGLQAGEDGGRFVVGTARRTPWPIVASHGSMHTSPAALSEGHRHIRELGTHLQRQGRLGAVG